MKFEINVEVKLDTGAEILLTPQQLKSINAFATKVVFGGTKLKGARVMGARAWTDEEVKDMLETLKGVAKGERRNKLMQKLAAKFGRTYKAVYVRYFVETHK